MDGVKRYDAGEAVSVATIQKRRRHVTCAEALEIRQRKVAEMFYGENLSLDAISLVQGQSRETVRKDLRAAEARARAQGKARRRVSAGVE